MTYSTTALRGIGQQKNPGQDGPKWAENLAEVDDVQSFNGSHTPFCPYLHYTVGSKRVSCTVIL